MGRLRGIIVTVVMISIVMTGCGKKYSDYERNWVTADGKLLLTPDGSMTIDIDEVDQTRNINVLSDSGRSYLHICYGVLTEASTEQMIWDAYANVRGNKLYLKIDKDYVSDYEGTTFVLTQSDEPRNEKKYSDYRSDWVSEDKTVRITPDGQVTMNISGVDSTKHVEVEQGDWDQDMWFCYGEEDAEPESSEEPIWKAEGEIREDTLYLSVYEDNASDYKGKIIVLTQDTETSLEEPTEK